MPATSEVILLISSCGRVGEPQGILPEIDGRAVGTVPLSNTEKARRFRAAHPHYHRDRVAAERASWFLGKSCAQCGAGDLLEIDHIDRLSKVDHRVFSWKKERRESELAKCRVLCRDCHRERTSLQLSGESSPRARLTNEQALAIWGLRGSKGPTAIARQLGIPVTTANNVLQGKAWGRVTGARPRIDPRALATAILDAAEATS